jgi:hypothetical protein
MHLTSYPNTPHQRSIVQQMMPKERSLERSLVRASEIGLWSFCQRAWWLARVKGTPHRNPTLLSRGQEAHHRHGRVLRTAQRLAVAGQGLVVLALLLAGAALIVWLAS